ncbi:MAG: Crp/Fnr family transcriptional regulator [Myxococcota bacterium]
MSDAIANLLMTSDLFQGLSRKEVSALIGAGRVRTYEPKEVVFLKGSPSDALYLVVSGRIGVISGGPDGHVLNYRSIESGDILGEIGVLDGGVRSTAASAELRTELLVIPKKAFERFLDDHPTATRAILVILARRLRSTSGLLEDTLFLDALRRVARRLLEAAVSSGDRAPRVDLTQEALGQRAGLSRVSVNHQLQKLKELGLIEIETGRVRLKDPAGLSALVDGRD